MGQMLETPRGTRIPLGSSGYLAKQLLSLRPRVPWRNPVFHLPLLPDEKLTEKQWQQLRKGVAEILEEKEEMNPYLKDLFQEILRSR